MIARHRKLRLTGIRREILAGLRPGRGSSADQLKRTVATGRGLVAGGAGWLSFNTSFSRALRLLEQHGAIVVRRDDTLFNLACVTWVALTEEGARERARLLVPEDGGLGLLAPEAPTLVSKVKPFLERATDRELEQILLLVQQERSRRICAPF